MLIAWQMEMNFVWHRLKKQETAARPQRLNASHQAQHNSAQLMHTNMV